MNGISSLQLAWKHNKILTKSQQSFSFFNRNLSFWRDLVNTKDYWFKSNGGQNDFFIISFTAVRGIACGWSL
jgi:hypothetical protein